jgi:hypothetical protein
MAAVASRLTVALVAILTACRAPGERPAAAGGQKATDAGAGEYHPPRDLAKVDLCALLPPAEIPARYGQVIEGPKLTRDPNGKPTCWYVLAPNTGLVVELLDAAWYDMQRSVWEPGKTEGVPGVGEKAFLVKLKPPSDPYLVAAEGDVAVKVTTRNLELARDVARAILGRKSP